MFVDILNKNGFAERSFVARLLGGQVGVQLSLKGIGHLCRLTFLLPAVDHERLLSG